MMDLETWIDTVLEYHPQACFSCSPGFRDSSNQHRVMAYDNLGQYLGRWFDPGDGQTSESLYSNGRTIFET